MHTRSSAGLDGLRGISALVVMVTHAAVLPFSDPFPVLVQTLGFAGRAAVIVFFVLSGHVITSSILAMRARGGFSPAVYAINRFARVYPPFLLCLCLAWMVVWLRSQGWIDPQPRLMAEPIAATATNLLRDLVFLFGSGTPVQNANAPVWSLRIEVVCYVIAGLAAVGLQSGVMLRVVLMAAAIALALMAAMRLESAVLGFAAFGAGALTTMVRRAPPRWVLAVAVGALCLLAGALLGLGVGLEPRHGWPRMLRLFYEAVAVCAAAILVLDLSLGEDGTLHAGFRRMSWIAPFSYTLFITHLPLIVILAGFVGVSGDLASRLVAFGALAAAAMAFAWSAAQVVEQHVALRRWLVARLGLRS
jgi:peptidoglycan/LPS O-acetylase OafA/YrhL